MSARRYIFLPAGATNPGAISSGSRPIQVFLDSIDSLFWDGLADGTGKVNIGLGGTPDAIQIAVTDATDATVMLAQINSAIASTGNGVIITGDPSAPTATTALDATAGAGQVALTWTNTDTRNQVQVWRSTTTGAETLYQTLAVGSASYTDINVTVGTEYFYTVYTVNARGSTENTTGEVSATPTQTPPPDTLVATATGYYQISLTWNPVASAMSYKIYRGPVGGPYLAVGVSGTASYLDPSVPATLTEYVVTAVINNSESVYSAPADATPTALAQPALTVGSAPYALNLTWPAVSGATSYNIYRGTSSGGETLINQAFTNSYNDTPLPYTQGYFYYVTAVANGIEGPQSAEQSGTATTATFTGVSPQPAAVTGGILTFTGSGFDPSQAGNMVYGVAEQTVLPVTYVDSGTMQLYYPGGLTPGDVQFYYQVAGSLYALPFLVAFA